jgi:hypothetical protein
MTQITFKQQFTYPEESVKGFALFLGWQERLSREIEVVDDDTTTPITTHKSLEEYDNPQTFSSFVEHAAKEHSLKFIRSWAENIAQSELHNQIIAITNVTGAELHNQIVTPVEDALVSEVITE